MENYFNQVKEAVKGWIENEIEIENYHIAEDHSYDFDALEDELNDALWAEDSVTGNASGSYTCDCLLAKQCVLNGIDTLSEAANDGFVSFEKIGRAMCENGWEKLDVICRCYVLPAAIRAAVDEI